MKIRTKLILLLSAALIVTMLVSTWLRIRWTQRRLEEQLTQSAQDTAVAIADELSQRLRSDMDQDEISEQLKDEQRRHPGGDLVLNLDTDEDTVSTLRARRSRWRTPRSTRSRAPAGEASRRRSDGKRRGAPTTITASRRGRRGSAWSSRCGARRTSRIRRSLAAARRAGAAAQAARSTCRRKGAPGKIIVEVRAPIDPRRADARRAHRHQVATSRWRRWCAPRRSARS